MLLVGLQLLTNLIFSRKQKDKKEKLSGVVPVNSNKKDENNRIEMVEEEPRKHLAIRFVAFLNHQYDFHICVGFLVSIQIDVFLALAIVIKIAVRDSLVSLISILFGIAFLVVYVGIFLTFGYITF